MEINNNKVKGGLSNEMEQAQLETPIAIAENNNSFDYLIDRVIEIFCNERLTPKRVFEFKNNLKTIKELYGIEISKEYLKPYFKQHRNTAERTRFTKRFNIICDKADLQTRTELRYKKVLTSKNGILYIDKDREVMTFFNLK